MARTVNGNLTGRAASVELREQREYIAAAQRKHAKDVLMGKCDYILDVLGQDDYHAWLDATPEDGFTMAVETKLAEVYAAEQHAANLRAGAEVIARLDAEAQAIELAAEADWLGTNTFKPISPEERALRDAEYYRKLAKPVRRWDFKQTWAALNQVKDK